MKKCLKCKSRPGFNITVDLEGVELYLCTYCLIRFVNKLAEWKDIELDEELKHYCRQ